MSTPASSRLPGFRQLQFQGLDGLLSCDPIDIDNHDVAGK